MKARIDNIKILWNSMEKLWMEPVFMLTEEANEFFAERAQAGSCPAPAVHILGCFKKSLFLSPDLKHIHNRSPEVRKNLNTLVRKVITRADFILNIESSYKVFWNADDAITMEAAIKPYVAFDIAHSVAEGLYNPLVKKAAISNKVRQLAKNIMVLCGGNRPVIIPSIYYMSEGLEKDLPPNALGVPLVSRIADELVGGNIDELARRISSHVPTLFPVAKATQVLNYLKSGTVTQNGTAHASYKVTHKTAEAIARGIKAEAKAQSKTLSCLNNSEPTTDNLFSTDPTRGQRSGQATRALPVALGNIV